MASLPDFPPFNVHEDSNADPQDGKSGSRDSNGYFADLTSQLTKEKQLCSCTTLALMSMISTILCRLAATKTTKP